MSGDTKTKRRGTQSSERRNPRRSGAKSNHRPAAGVRLLTSVSDPVQQKKKNQKKKRETERRKTLSRRHLLAMSLRLMDNKRAASSCSHLLSPELQPVHTHTLPAPGYRRLALVQGQHSSEPAAKPSARRCRCLTQAAAMPAKKLITDSTRKKGEGLATVAAR